LLSLLKVPLSHAVQVRSSTVEPSELTYVPGVQVVLSTHGVAGLPSLSHVPAAQATGWLVPPAQKLPGSQTAQTAGEVGVPDAICTVPAAQLPHGWQLVWFALLEYCPLGHSAQIRSTVVDGVLVTNVPGKQVVQAVHVGALLDVLKVPLAHAAQVRSLVVEPSLAT
jgi:hypothetical protein